MEIADAILAFDWALHYWWIELAVLVGGFLLLFVLVSLFEKQPVNAFSRLAPGEEVNHTPYARVMAAQARQLGFLGGEVVRHVKGKRYRVTSTAWFDVDRRTLLFIGSGKIFGTRVRRTVLFSRLDDERFLVTSDEFGEGDLSGAFDMATLTNADLYELQQHHRIRAAKLGHLARMPLAFVEQTPFDAYCAIERIRSERNIARGWGSYTDADHSFWRYTPTGVIHLIAQTFRPKSVRIGTNLSRIKLPRPGEAKYAPRTDGAIPSARPLTSAHADDPAPLDATMVKLPNVTWDASPVTFELHSPHVVAFDPLMLDVLRDEEVATEGDVEALAAAARRLAEREPAFAYFAAYPFRPGRYRFDPDRMTRLDSLPNGEAGGVAVDSGALIVIDAAALPLLVAHLDWETYDRMLQADGDELIESLIDRLGGPRFALIHADATRAFAGDGTYRLQPEALRPA